MAAEHRPSRAGSAYLVRPGPDGDGVGPGVLVLTSWWGPTPAAKEFCHRLADAGFVVVLPDLMGGVLAETSAQAEAELEATDPNSVAALVLSSAVALRSASVDTSAPVAVIGFSMGGSWALWAATRQPESFDRVVTYYGTQTIDFGGLRAKVLGHFAERDEIVDDDELVLMESELFEAGHRPEVWHYDGVGHFFAEAGVEGYDEPAAELAWQRTLEFLRS